MPSDTQITAKLRDAVKITNAHGESFLIGRIYEDRRHRWPDGRLMHSSLITSEHGTIFVTLNSVYEVESWLAPDQL